MKVGSIVISGVQLLPIHKYVSICGISLDLEASLACHGRFIWFVGTGPGIRVIDEIFLGITMVVYFVFLDHGLGIDTGSCLSNVQ